MQEINLYDLLKYYARNWLNLLSALFIGAIIGLVYTNFVQTPLYKSDATMLVVGARTSQDTTINNNYTELFKSRRVLETVIEQQGYNGDYAQLLARTTATNDKNTDIIRVSIADPDGRKSEQLLSASLEAFKREASAIYDSNNIKTVDAASIPYSPYNVNVVMQVGLAMAAAFFLIVIVLFFVYDYRTSQIVPATPTRKTTASKTKTGAKTGAKTAKGKGKSKRAVTVASQRQPLIRQFTALFTGPITPASASESKKTK